MTNSTNITRDEHVAWCKHRALAELDAGSAANAFASMVSDLRKHPETVNHAGMELGAMLMLSGNLSTSHEMRKFIEGFH